MSFIYQLEKQLVNGEKSLEEISDYLPSYVHTNNLDDFEVIESDNKLCNLLSLSMEELVSLKLDDVVHPVDLHKSIQLTKNYLANLEHQHFIQFFQRTYLKSRNYEELLFTSSRLMDGNKLLNLSTPVKKIELFNKKIWSLLEEADFIKNNIHKFALLTPKEIEIASLLAKGYSLNEVSIRNNISLNTAKKHRRNIYSKLEVTNYYEFYRFAKIFKLDI